MNEIRLEKWAVVFLNADPYKAPELQQASLMGEAHGHPRFPDGSKITTSRPKSVEGRRVTTSSGSVYVLGEPDPEWVAAMASIGRTVDPEQPLKLL
jgi:hypothetical protein